MTKPNPAMLEVVENQLRDGTPPETKQTLDRLIKEGHSEEEAKRLIATVVASEIFGVFKNKRPYDQARYIAALQRLPKVFDDK
ncbi:MAG: hypothetical protein HZC38_20075 [Chloroflexi bacterium]|nr:hypothetical protein [Chloroflexota bacterium]